MNMIIKKILNNNVVITTNYQMEEIIVMGKGLAYGKQAGDNIDMNKINKTFEVSLKPSQITYDFLNKRILYTALCLYEYDLLN